MRRISISLFFLTVASLLPVVTGTASAELVAHWQFDGDFTDATGNGHDGTPIANPATVDDPMRGQVLEVDVVDRLRIADAADLNYGSNESMTLTAWANYEPAGSPTGWKGIVVKGRTEVGGGTGFVDTLYGFWVSPTGNWHINSGALAGDAFAAEGNEWHHLAFVQNASTGQGFFYIDAEVAMTGGAASCDTTGRDLYIGATGTDQASAFEAFKGRIDDVRIYDQALSQAEIEALATPPTASQPDPADGSSVGPEIWEDNVYLMLKYTPGVGAVTHTAYFSDVEQDVIDRDTAHSLGSVPPWPALDPIAFVVGYDDPGIPEYARTPLVLGKTYYWCIDEFDGASTWPGEVWNFTVMPRQAWGPTPAEGDLVPGTGTMTWNLGDVEEPGATFSYNIYIGVDKAAITAIASNDTTSPHFVAQASTESYDYAGLAPDTEHFWRVDTRIVRTRPPFIVEAIRGDVWSFTTLPEVCLCLEELVGWYKLDGEIPGHVFDYSGYENHGTLWGDPQYLAGYVDNGLDLDGMDDFVDFGTPSTYPDGLSPRSMCAWAKTDSLAGGWAWIAAYGNPGTSQAMFIGRNADDLFGGGYGDDISYADFWQTDTWHHICLTYDGTTARLYADGMEMASLPKTWNLAVSRAHIGRQVNDAAEFWDGTVDEVRIYNKALSEKEVKILAGMLAASNPDPADNAVDVPRTPTLSFSPGVLAVAVNGNILYYSEDKDAVIDRTAPSVTLTAPNFTLPMTLDLGTTFYWAVDTVNGIDIWPGDVWSFTVRNWLPVDDMESYTPWLVPGNNIFEAWVDGESNCIPGNGNETGSTLTENMDMAYVLGGLQSMKYEFDSDGLVYSPCTMTQTPRPHYYSKIEAQTATLPSGIGSDWTVEGVKALQINFMGQLGNSETEPLWVQLQDSSKTYGTKVFYGDVEGEDLADFNDPSWHEWNIDLADFNVDLTNVVSIVIGIGNEGATTAGGSGTIYVDEIRLYTPRCVPNRAKPAGDFDNSCDVDYPDMEMLFDNWLLQAVPEVPDSGWMTTDIGDVGVLTGSYSDLGGGEFKMTGAGADIWGTADGGFYRYKSLSGDGRLTVRVRDVTGPSTNDWRKAGVMIRETLDAGSKHAFMATSPVGGGGKSFQRRIETDQASTSAHGIPPTVTTPICLRIARQGDTFRGFYNIGAGWVQQGDPITIEMAENVYIGFAITSHDYSNSTTVTFDNVCSGDFIEPDLVEDGVINFEDYADLLNQWLDKVLWPQ